MTYQQTYVTTTYTSSYSYGATTPGIACNSNRRIFSAYTLSSQTFGGFIISLEYKVVDAPNTTIANASLSVLSGFFTPTFYEDPRVCSTQLNEGFIVAYIVSGDLYYKRFTSAGVARDGSDIFVATATRPGSNELNLHAIGADDLGRFTIVYRYGPDANNSGLYFIRYNDDGTVSIPATLIDSISGSTDEFRGVGLNVHPQSGKISVAYYKTLGGQLVRIKQYDASGSPVYSTTSTFGTPNTGTLFYTRLASRYGSDELALIYRVESPAGVRLLRFNSSGSNIQDILLTTDTADVESMAYLASPYQSGENKIVFVGRTISGGSFRIYDVDTDSTSTLYTITKPPPASPVPPGRLVQLSGFEFWGLGPGNQIVISGTPTSNYWLEEFGDYPTASTVLRKYPGGSSVYSNSRLIETDITEEANVTSFFVSETVSSRSVAQNSSFSATEPTTVIVSDSDGIKTIYTWVKSSHTVALNAAIATIVLDRVINATPVLLMRDRTSGSTAFTDSQIVSVFDLSFGPEQPLCRWSLRADTTVPSSYSALPMNSTFNMGAGDGLRTVYLWYRDPALNVAGPYTSFITLDTAINVTLSLDLSERSTGSRAYTETQIISTGASASGSEAASSTYLLTESSSVPATTDPSFNTMIPSTFALSFVDGLKTVYFWAKDTFGHMASVSDTITLDSSINASIFLSVTDRTSGSTTHTNQQLISTQVSTSGNGTSSFKWLLTESVTAPVQNDPAFTISIPFTFNLSAPTNVLKTVHLWAKSAAGRLLSTSDTITLDTVLNATFSLSIFDRTSGSASLTNEQIISTSINGSGVELSSLYWLLTESIGTPSELNPGFSTIVPITFALNAITGLKTVRLWAKDNAGNILGTTDTIRLDPSINATILLSLTDRTSGSTTYTNNEIISSSISGSGTEFSSLQWILTENANTPSEFDPNFSLVAPVTFDLSSGDGLKTVYLWAKDNAGNILGLTDSITLDTSFDASISLNLTDRSTGSSVATNEQTISTEIIATGTELSSLIWLITQSSSVPSELNPGFASGMPEQFVLSAGDGLKTVFLWAKDPAGNMIGTSDTITLATGFNASLLFDAVDRTSGSSNLTDEPIVSTIISASGPDSSGLQYLVTESSGTPSSSDPGFSTTAPSTFEISKGDGTKTLFMWAKNTLDVMAFVSSTISLDGVLGILRTIIMPSLSIEDRSSGSSVLTNDHIVSTTINLSPF